MLTPKNILPLLKLAECCNKVHLVFWEILYSMKIRNRHKLNPYKNLYFLPFFFFFNCLHRSTYFLHKWICRKLISISMSIKTNWIRSIAFKIVISRTGSTMAIHSTISAPTIQGTIAGSIVSTMHQHWIRSIAL